MFSIKIHKRIHQILSVFSRLGLWHRSDKATIKETRVKFFYSIYYLFYPISLMGGAIFSETKDEWIFLVEAAIVIAVALLKLLYIIWNKNQILDFLNQICIYLIDKENEFNLASHKLNRLMKFVTIFLSFACFSGFCLASVVPFLGSQRSLFFNIAFPLDWKTNEIAYWIAFTFIFTETILSAISVLFSVIMWYLMINCALRYEVLGYDIKNMGAMRPDEKTSNNRKISNVEKQNIFRRDLIAAIKSHMHIKDLTNELMSFLSTMFLIQTGTGSICICGSTYSLAFNSGESVIEYLIYINILLYNIFDIFMIMYMGNEISLSSDRLSYCLFESDWIDQPQSTKKDIIIFGELLQQPHQLIILKLYSLTLETFMRILNSAYSMFNILQNFK